MPASAPALRASLPDLTAPPMAGSSGPGHVEHEKKTFFSLLKNTRSGGISQGRASAAAAGGAKRRAFTDAGAEGTAREREKGPIHPDPLFSTGLRT
jgi:hypothetical protein